MMVRRGLLSLLLSLLAATAFAQGVTPTVTQNGLTETTFTGRTGEVQASPTANTILGRLKALEDAVASLDALLTSIDTSLADPATETTLSAINTKIPASPATDRAAAAAPFSVRLSDGTSFYKATTPSDTQPVSAASLPLPTGAATAANQDGIIRDGLGDTTQANVSGGRVHVDGSGVTQPVSGTVAATQSGTWNIGSITTLPALPTGSNTIGNIGTIATSVTPGTAAANLGKAEDAAAGNGDTGVVPFLQRQDTPASTASATNDYITPKGNSYGHTFTASICNDPTLTNSVAISQSALNGNAELVALTASQTIYVCGYSFISSGAANVRLVYGTGTACATGETGITGAYPLVANTGIAVANGGAIQAKTAASNALCIETSASVNVMGMVTYAKF